MSFPLSSAESQRASWFPWAPRHVFLETLYDKKSNSIFLITMSSFCVDHPYWWHWRVYRFFGRANMEKFECVGDKFESTKEQTLIRHEHEHSDVWICPLKDGATSGERSLELEIRDNANSFVKSTHVVVELAVEESRQYRLISCSSPLSDKARYLPEWIEYHRIMGVEHFYVYVWDPDEELQRELARYSRLGLVTVIEWSLPTRPGVNHVQPHAQTHCLQKYGASAEYVGQRLPKSCRRRSLTDPFDLFRWILYNDLDEFFRPTRPKMDLPQAIDDLLQRNGSDIGAILTRGVIFGPSMTFNRSEYDHLVLEHFTRSAATVGQEIHDIKFLTKPSCTRTLSVRIL